MAQFHSRAARPKAQLHQTLPMTMLSALDQRQPWMLVRIAMFTTAPLVKDFG